MGLSAGPKPLPTDYPWKPLTRGVSVAFGIVFAAAMALLALSIMAMAGAL